MNLSALVLHNVGPTMLTGYHAEGSDLFHAHEFQIVADNVEQAANLVWDLANVGDSNELHQMRPNLGLYGQQVNEYRARMNRSLSVGDVIVFHEIGSDEPRFAGALAVAGVGFTTLHAMPPYKQGSNTTALSESYKAHCEWREGGFNEQAAARAISQAFKN